MNQTDTNFGQVVTHKNGFIGRVEGKISGGDVVIRSGAERMQAKCGDVELELDPRKVVAVMTEWAKAQCMYPNQPFMSAGQVHQFKDMTVAEVERRFCCERRD